MPNIRFLLCTCLLVFAVACQSPTETHYQRTEPVSAIPSKVLYGWEIDSLKVFKGVFKANENLGEILTRYKVSNAQLAAIGNLPREEFDVRRLLANKPYTIIHTPDTVAQGFVYHPNKMEYVAVSLDDSISVSHGLNDVDTLKHTISGVIESSLYESMLKEGASPVLVNKLADVYAWEIDFFGLQKGDTYAVIYESFEVDGEHAGLGNIISARFTHMEETNFAFSYDQGEGLEFFDEGGNSLRKTFLKAPLNFSRISSRFSYSRLHPILKIRRPHLGVDYAAPRGTPVQAVGDGIVTKANYSGGAGHMVKIKHNSNYQTSYLHLYRYGKGISVGTKVKQGQIIGYVGSTGLSTGPHLDFRFYKNGKAVDPLKVDPPSSTPVVDSLCGEFMEHSRIWLRELQKIPKKELPVDSTIVILQ